MNSPSAWGRGGGVGGANKGYELPIRLGGGEFTIRRLG